MHKILKTLALSAAILAVATATAENSTVTPYSRFGYGMLDDKANTMQKSMGGVGVAMRSGRAINFMNPASYAAIDSLTFLFDMGVDLKVLRSTDEGASGHNTTGGLNYITLQVPVTKWLGASAGLIPYSEVGYNFSQDIPGGVNTRTGSGGINEVYLGFGAKPVKGLTAGFNLSYLYGTLTNDSYVYANTTTLFERSVEVRDYNLRFGVQYGREVSRDHTVTLGAIFQPGKSLHGRCEGTKYDVTSNEGAQTIADIDLKGNASLPATWGFGVNYMWGQRLMAEADFNWQPWSKCKWAHIPEFDNSRGFNDRWKANVGVQFIARPRGTWVQRINYRFGAYLCNDYIKAGDNNVRERGVSLGFGLPAPSTKTTVNLSFEYRNRRAHPQPLVKENYFVMTLGVNFNELWFWRNKIR